MRERLVGLLALALLCLPSAHADDVSGIIPCAPLSRLGVPDNLKDLGMVQLMLVDGKLGRAPKGGSPRGRPTNAQLLPVIVVKTAQNGQLDQLLSKFNVYTFDADPEQYVEQPKGGHSFVPLNNMPMNAALVATAGKPSTPGGPAPVSLTVNPLPVDYTGSINSGGWGTLRVGNVLTGNGHFEWGGIEAGDGLLGVLSTDLAVAHVRLGKNGPILGVLAHAGAGYSQSNLLSGTEESVQGGAGVSLTVPTKDPKIPLRIFAVGGPEATTRSIGTPVQENLVSPSFSSGVELLFF